MLAYDAYVAGFIRIVTSLEEKIIRAPRFHGRNIIL